ncbi:MAG: SRPBCC family protein [Filimonas sp.]|nr:SRPBCC family protein [Filimonas sp.]
MKVLKKILLVLVTLIVLLLVISFFLPSSYNVSRSATFKASPDSLFAQFNDFRNWQKWNAFDDDYKSVSYVLSEPPYGKGAKQSWVANEKEKGEMTITASDPAKFMSYNIYFGGFDKPMIGEVSFAPTADGGTTVTWVDKGELGNNPLYKWMCVLFMKSWMNKAMDKSFSNIKGVVEH